MSLYLYDGATPWTADSLRLVKAHGGIAVSVYIVGSPGGMRHASAADVALARSMGLAVLPNWERAADFFRTASLADCKAAGAEALTACRELGFPDDGSIAVAFSFDYDVPASGFAQALAQLQACRDGLAGHYQAIGYAQIDLINYWNRRGMRGPHWLMGSTWRASSTFAPSEVGAPAVALVQSHTLAGAWLNSPVSGTDINTITQPFKLPAWWPDGSPYGGDVALTDDDIAKVAAAVWGRKFPAHPGGAEYNASSFLVAGADHADEASDSAAAAATAGANLVTRVATLQATVAQLQTDLAELKAAQASVQINPADLPVTGTVHIGGTS